ncbi:MAG TPA: hypothetical protein VJU84_21420 [Pyrinomonadaceae bacterium]|nr:hypothetical protein [Pyrinomonadaceae bacterium]
MPTFEKKTFSKTVPRCQLLTSIVCSLLIGFVLWRMTLRSGAELTGFDYVVLVLHLLLTLSFYLSTLWLVSRYCNLSSREAIPALGFVSIVGTSFPFIVSSIHIYLNNPLVLRWFVSVSADLLLLLNLMMLLVMMSLAGVGFLLTKFFQAIAKVRKSAKIPA